ncbi:MAG: hypothetical protein RR250_01095 [Akkermansia sp.]
MDTSTTIYVVIGTVLAGFLIFAVLKGIIKMILFGASVLCAIVAYFWISKYGYSYLSFITSDPRSWMVTTLAWGSAICVFAVFTHGLFWFSNVFSWGRKMGFGGVKGIITTLLMVCVLVWVGLVAIFYYGSVADIKRAHEYALAQSNAQQTISTPWVYSWKKKICETESTQWIAKFDPLTDEERLSLAKIVAYLATFEPQDAVRHYSVVAPHIPRPRRLWNLSRDVAIRASVEKEDMATLLNHPELTKFLSDQSSRDAVKRFPVEDLLHIKLPMMVKQGSSTASAKPPKVTNPSSPQTRPVNPIAHPVRVEH